MRKHQRAVASEICRTCSCLIAENFLRSVWNSNEKRFDELQSRKSAFLAMYRVEASFQIEPRRGDRYGAPMDAPQEALALQAGQVPSDRFRGYAQVLGQGAHVDPALAAGSLDDLLQPFLGVHPAPARSLFLLFYPRLFGISRPTIFMLAPGKGE